MTPDCTMTNPSDGSIHLIPHIHASTCSRATSTACHTAWQDRGILTAFVCHVRRPAQSPCNDNTVHMQLSLHAIRHAKTAVYPLRCSVMAMQLDPVPCNVPITPRVTVNRAAHHVRTAFFHHPVERCVLRMQSFLQGKKISEDTDCWKLTALIVLVMHGCATCWRLPCNFNMHPSEKKRSRPA